MTQTTKIAGYTTYGSVRGCCGHTHTTVEQAERCLNRDESGCSKQGGYSDRSIVAVGDDGYLYRDRDCQDWIPGPGGTSCGAARISD